MMRRILLSALVVASCNASDSVDSVQDAAVVIEDAALLDASIHDASARDASVPDANTLNACSTALDFPPTYVVDDGYHRFELCEWTIYMHIDLFGHELGSRVFADLAEDLAMIQQTIPTAALDFLKTVPIWLELDVPAFPGGVYHASEQWLSENGHPTKWAKGVQLGNANNFLTWVEQQPAMVLHEMAHAYLDQKYVEPNPDTDDVSLSVTNSYYHALEFGYYDSVLYVNGQYLEAYAKTNVQEYFAELSEAYFWENDYFPFIRSELATHDTDGFAAIEAAWTQP